MDYRDVAVIAGGKLMSDGAIQRRRDVVGWLRRSLVVDR